MCIHKYVYIRYKPCSILSESTSNSTLVNLILTVAHKCNIIQPTLIQLLKMGGLQKLGGPFLGVSLLRNRVSSMLWKSSNDMPSRRLEAQKPQAQNPESYPQRENGGPPAPQKPIPLSQEIWPKSGSLL